MIDLSLFTKTILTEDELNSVLAEAESPWVIFEAATADNYAPFESESQYNQFHRTVIKLLLDHASNTITDPRALKDEIDLLSDAFEGGVKYGGADYFTEAYNKLPEEEPQEEIIDQPGEIEDETEVEPDRDQNDEKSDEIDIVIPDGGNPIDTTPLNITDVIALANGAIDSAEEETPVIPEVTPEIKKPKVEPEQAKPIASVASLTGLCEKIMSSKNLRSYTPTDVMKGKIEKFTTASDLYNPTDAVISLLNNMNNAKMIEFKSGNLTIHTTGNAIREYSPEIVSAFCGLIRRIKADSVTVKDAMSEMKLPGDTKDLDRSIKVAKILNPNDKQLKLISDTDSPEDVVSQFTSHITSKLGNQTEYDKQTNNSIKVTATVDGDSRTLYIPLVDTIFDPGFGDMVTRISTLKNDSSINATNAAKMMKLLSDNGIESFIDGPISFAQKLIKKMNKDIPIGLLLKTPYKGNHDIIVNGSIDTNPEYVLWVSEDYSPGSKIKNEYDQYIKSIDETSVKDVIANLPELTKLKSKADVNAMEVINNERLRLLKKVIEKYPRDELLDINIDDLIKASNFPLKSEATDFAKKELKDFIGELIPNEVITSEPREKSKLVVSTDDYDASAARAKKDTERHDSIQSDFEAKNRVNEIARDIADAAVADNKVYDQGSHIGDVSGKLNDDGSEMSSYQL